MKRNYKEFKLTSVFKGDKAWSADEKQQNYNNHVVTVSNTETKQKASFEFWGSIVNPEIKTESELLNAFYCFVEDALSGKMDFSEFCSEFGYDEDSRKAEKTWKACKRSTVKFDRLYSGDIYDFVNELQEIAG